MKSFLERLDIDWSIFAPFLCFVFCMSLFVSIALRGQGPCNGNPHGWTQWKDEGEPRQSDLNSKLIQWQSRRCTNCNIVTFEAHK